MDRVLSSLLPADHLPGYRPALTARMMAKGTAWMRKRKDRPREVHSRSVADLVGDTGSFEELAMPLFANLYNFAHWLTQDRAAGGGPRAGNLHEGAARFFLF